MNSIVATLTRLPKMILIAMVKAYRLLISPWLGSNCRFEPSCSTYSLQALNQHGAAIGSYLTLRRLMRCQPWCEGGHDLVPQPNSASFFSRLLTPAASIPSKKTPS
ncbi:MAG: membrane protein insertion efficiency factor YidD [Polaromonas sp.]